MQNAEQWYPFIPYAGALLAFLCLLAALVSGKRKRLINALPTSKTSGIFIGLIEVKGKAECEEPITSYLKETHCVHYEYSITEKWSRQVTETYTDDKGNTQTRTRTESGWTPVGGGGSQTDFYLVDDYGCVLVRPEGATVEPETICDEICTPLNSLYYGKGPVLPVPHSDFIRHFVERAIVLHAPLYIMGQARERKDIVAPEIAEDKTAPMYLISTRSEEAISRGYSWKFWLSHIGGMALAAGGLVLRDQVTGRDLPAFIPWYVAAAAAYWVFAAFGWLWMVYNSFIDLHQRVMQAWSLVDVQLKRRFDLIPRVVEVVRGLRDYEVNVQEQLAMLRSQMAATRPGEAGPDPHGVQGTLIAIQEKYPELKSNESFLALQHELSNTEQRIALARGYFNDIATHYNTKLEVVPDRFVAGLAGLKPQALIGAEAFERAPVEVQFAET